MDEARAVYQAVAKAHPENAPALNNAAFFLADTGGDLDEALRLAKNALAKIPGQPSFSDTIAYIYLKKGMLDSAIQSFSTLAQRYPDVRQLPLPLGTGVVAEGRESAWRARNCRPRWPIIPRPKRLCESGSCSMRSANRLLSRNRQGAG